LADFCRCLAAHENEIIHLVAANEGNAIALAAGYYVATGQPGLVYMQNSGLGNAVNPLLSLTDPTVFSLPVLILMGWRGEPGFKDEPQHAKQGLITQSLLADMGLPFEVLPSNEEGIIAALNLALRHFKEKSSPYVLLVRKNTFTSRRGVLPAPELSSELNREAAIKEIVEAFGSEARFVASTGMIARELFEYRGKTNTEHGNDLLVVGSMGHASSVALGLALGNNRPIVCLDGDGAFMMHMGAAAISGVSKADNFHHIILNNAAHDSVGGLGTVANQVDLAAVAQACAYKHVQKAVTRLDLKRELRSFANLPGPSFLEVKVSKGARPDLGRPTESPKFNIENFRQKLTSSL